MDRRARPRGAAVFMFFLILAMSLALGPPARAAAEAGLPDDLKGLIAEALKANPDLKRLDQLKVASQKQIPSAGALEDPMLSAGVVNVPTNKFSFTQEDMTMKEVMLSQKFPYPGKRRLKSQMAGEQARADEFTYKDKANEIRARVVQAYWGLALSYALFDITQKNKKFWELVVEVAQTRYSLGKGNQSEVLQAQVELGMYLDRLLDFQQRQESFRADLNNLRSKPPQTPISRPQALRAQPYVLKLDWLLAQGEAQPQLQGLKAMVARQEKAVDLARKEYFPDVTVGVAYGIRNDLSATQKQSDMFTGRVSVNLPIWRRSKLNPQLEEQQARKNAAEEDYKAVSNRIAAAIKDRHAKLERLKQQVALFNQAIIPQARQGAEASLAGYQVGKIDFARVYQDQIAAYSAEMKLQEYLKDYEENWAELEWLVGRDLPRRAGGIK
jgi:cobalt-zinc-cadmium efflux system outer membrane protein